MSSAQTPITFVGGFRCLRIYNRFAQDQLLLDDIAKAINGEYSAIMCYEQITRMAPDERIRQQVLEIRADETRHFQEFSRIYFRLAGRQPMPQISEACPGEYGAALHFAFRDEQETVDFYHDIADKAGDAEIGRAFRRAAADEQNHAVWFLYFLMQR